MKRLILCIGVACLLLFPKAGAALPMVDVEAAVGGWHHSPSGYTSYEADDRLELEDVLDYEAETRLTGRLKIDMPSLFPGIYLMASPMEFSESSVADQAYKFGDITMQPGAAFSSELTLDQYDVGLFYDIPLMEAATLKRLNIEVGLNARVYDAEATIVQDEPQGLGIRESASETALVPMGYLGISVRPLETVAFEGEFRGITYRDTDLLSLIGRLKVDTFGPLFITGGYRYERGESRDWDFEFDMDFSGPFLEAGLEF
jgi:outer membrane protein